MKLWIARDPDGGLCIYRYKPYQKPSGFWTCLEGEYFLLDDKSFPEITLENSPQEVELKLIEK